VAITNLSPTEDAATSQLISLQDASDLFEQSGCPIRPRTLKKHALAHGVSITTRGRTDYASWSALLDVQYALYPES
jgi:hypothetical protein